ncbi:methyl-accepting chemotaxis protein [Croceibacterium sp. LX-88]|uniref:Methyl-accepting chemotaxis protein n=1 Tax=Croceibacterium selenioxidans TaxID=2838833 RepID=A0ABS5W1R3_9SPHN|nr:methyl-accepting chemotaxis protein [Croceibacterium selenioxidans]MBT2133705.1 methyl-accepting chemotaxis protein [Croceibacterium selenioxidans]
MGELAVSIRPEIEDLLAQLGEQAGDISVQCSDTGGIVGKLNRQISAEAVRLDHLVEAMASLNGSQAESRGATEELLQTATVAFDVLERGNKVAQVSLNEVSKLVSDVTGIDGQLQGFLETLGTIGNVTRTLNQLAEQTELLSFNARIEAARGGEATRPFEVLATEIRRLAHTTSDSSTQVGRSITRLEQSAGTLIGSLKANIASGRETTRHIEALSESLSEMAALVHQFRDRSLAIAASNKRAEIDVATLDAGLVEFGEVAAESALRAKQACEQLDDLETRANDMLNQVAHGGIETRNTPLIDFALTGAREVTELIERHLGTAELREAALFDTHYVPRPGTDPVQYDNAFADFADKHVRPLLDNHTRLQRAVVGCCLIDMNGYLPTHITERSQGQIPGQRLRNLEFARNRQIFMDNQTRRALDGEGEFFLFAYRQDLGDGRFRALRSVFVPLTFAGRRWGLYEVGFLL